MEFITQHIAVILSTIFGGTSLLGWIFEKRKNKAQANTVEIGNSEKVINIYQKTLDDLTQRYEAKYLEITEVYERKIKILEDEIKLHKRTVNALKKEATEYRKKIKELENANNSTT